MRSATSPPNPLLLWREMVRPTEWSTCFAREAPLEVEIGFGNGDYLLRSARERPEHNFVGIEIPWPQIKRALSKLEKRELENVRLLQVDARTALERMFRSRSAHRFVSLFPCPWPKKRHARHRLFSKAFLRLANSRLVDGGELLIVTDSTPFADWILDQAEGSGFAAARTIVAPRYGTKYEHKWQGKGQTDFHELHLRKEEHVEVSVKEDRPVRARTIARFDADTFEPPNSHSTELHVQSKELLYDPQRGKAMLQVVVAEENLEQNFWIEIARRDDGWRIQPARGCGFIPTAGVQEALDLVRDAAM